MQIGLLAYRLISADCLLNWCHFDVKLSDVLAATIYIYMFVYEFETSLEESGDRRNEMHRS